MPDGLHQVVTLALLLDQIGFACLHAMARATIGVACACDHLINACDAASGESASHGKAEFVRLKPLLKEADDGAEQVIRVLKHQRGRARSSKQARLDAELIYFCDQHARMHQPSMLRRILAIARILQIGYNRQQSDNQAFSSFLEHLRRWLPSCYGCCGEGMSSR